MFGFKTVIWVAKFHLKIIKWIGLGLEYSSNNFWKVLEYIFDRNTRYLEKI